MLTVGVRRLKPLVPQAYRRGTEIKNTRTYAYRRGTNTSCKPTGGTAPSGLLTRRKRESEGRLPRSLPIDALFLLNPK